MIYWGILIMRIAMIYLGRRGAGGIISFELARHLDKDHQVTTYLSEFSENKSRWDNSNLDYVKVNTFRTAFSALWSIILPVQIRKVADLIHSRKPDILVFPMFHPWNSFIQRELKNIPSVVFVHDPRPHPDTSGWFYEKLENFSIRLASRCVVLSESFKASLAERGAGHDSVDVIPLGPFFYKAPPSIQRRTNDLPTILFFGRMTAYKGLPDLLQAYVSVRKDIPCQLTIVGEGRIKKMKELEHLEGVRLINRWISEEEIADVFNSADVVVLPYTSASQSGVIPIAAVHGLPVIATQVGGLAEQMEDGVSGWLLAPGDSAALAKTITEVLSNPEDASKRGQALKDRYEKKCSWDQAAQRLFDSMEIAIRASNTHG